MATGIVLLSLTFGSGCQGTARREHVQVDSTRCGFPLFAGQPVRITLGNGQTADVVIQPDGFITLSNGIRVRADSSAEALEEVVRIAFLEEGFDVRPVLVTPIQGFYVMGRVKRPAQYFGTPHTTALSAIALAGGLQEGVRSRSATILIERAHTGRRERVSFRKALSDPKFDPAVHSLDQIIVQ